MWIKATEQRPDKSGNYLCITDTGVIINLHYDIVLDAFNVRFSGYQVDAEDYDTELAIKYWQHIEKVPDDLEETKAFRKWNVHPKIYITDEDKHTLFADINNDLKHLRDDETVEEYLDYAFSADNLERYCSGDTGDFDYAYNAISKQLRKEYKAKYAKT